MKTEFMISNVARANFLSASRGTRPQSGLAWNSFERRRSRAADLASTPDVRASEVARGRALIADPNYPSREQIRKIALGLLAAGLSR